MHAPPRLFRRRRVHPAGLLVAALVLTLVPALVAAGRDAPAEPGVGDGPRRDGAGSATAGEVADGQLPLALASEHGRSAARSDGRDTAVPALAAIDGLRLLLPAEEAVVVGFHEASTDAALELDPVGRVVANENTTRFSPPATDPDGSDYRVLSSRGRAQAATSAIDVVLRDDEDVLAPVTGTVADVRTYWLYGEHRDHRIEVVPDEAPDLRVVLVHVDDVRVAAGEQVTAGESVLAGTANRFPFASQIDRETDPDRWPHVHLEVQPVDAPRPGDDTG